MTAPLLLGLILAFIILCGFMAVLFGLSIDKDDLE